MPFQFCLGIDVSKAKLDAVLYAPEAHTAPQRSYRQVANTSAGAGALCQWARDLTGCEPGELRVILEATSAYHLVAASTAYEQGCQVVVVNPRRARQYAKALGRLTKNDRVDAEVLARFGVHVRAHCWAPPPPAIHELWALLSRRATLEDLARREESRLTLTDLKCSPSAVCASLADSVRFCALASERMTQELEALFRREPELSSDRQLLLSIPGVGPDAANVLLCLLRGHDFRSPREAAAFCGVTPVHRHSGTRTTSGGHVSRERNRVFRAALRMPALSARRGNPQLQTVYDALIARGKHRRQAFVAIVHRLVRIAFGVLKHRRPYDPLWTSRTVPDSAPGVIPLKRLRRKNTRRLARLQSDLPDKDQVQDASAGRRPMQRARWPKRRWTAEEVRLLHEEAGRLPVQHLALRLQRTADAVQLKINAEGLSSLPRGTPPAQAADA